MKGNVVLAILILTLAVGAFACPNDDIVWTKVAESGSGCFPPNCTDGKYPMATLPLLAFDGRLYSIGGDRVWTSADGTTWSSRPKTDIGDRAGTQFAFFKNKLWMLGGMRSWDDFRNDVWSSRDGMAWERTVEKAPWKARRGHGVVVFNGKLWLLGGALSSGRRDQPPTQFVDDVWSSPDGIRWAQVTGNAPWRSADGIATLVFDDKIWVIGGKRDVWSSADGVSWKQVTAKAAWSERIGSGTLVYDNKIWIFGGRELNDVWSTANGKDWNKECDAPWSTRSANYSVVFRNKIWLFSGKTGREDSWDGAIWTLGSKNP